MKFVRRNKNLRRPRKGAAEKARRLKVQKRRLADLGVSEAEIEKMNSREVRIKLQRPARIKARA